MTVSFRKVKRFLFEEISIWPLVSLRVLFGLLMAIAAIRFWMYGWIEQMYIEPEFHFSYFGFDWIKPLPGIGMYLVFAGMVVSALSIALGFRFRLASIAYFILFTYVELIDKATYLNHYYFISIVAFLLVLSPAHKAMSVDAWRKRRIVEEVPRLYIWMFMLQLGIVYFFAGVAKLNYDWLIEALPMRIWLPASADLPVVGRIFKHEATAYIFSWAGAIYDLSIAFLLCWRKTRSYAYLSVIVFHILTWTLFPIGIFPWVMIFMTLIFFPAKQHEKVWNRIKKHLPSMAFDSTRKNESPTSERKNAPAILLSVLAIHFLIQLLLPLRSHWLSENLFWDELGFRFSWRVMLIEKTGAIEFTVVDGSTGKRFIVSPNEYLTDLQEREMATQPDMVIQFAHYLESIYKAKGASALQIYANSWVSLNESASQQFIDPHQDLLTVNPNDRLSWIIKQEKH